MSELTRMGSACSSIRWRWYLAKGMNPAGLSFSAVGMKRSPTVSVPGTVVQMVIDFSDSAALPNDFASPERGSAYSR